MANNKEIEFLDGQTLRIGNTVSPIEWSKDSFPLPNGEGVITEYFFTNSLGELASGALFRLREGGSTRVMRIVDPELICERIVVKGRGLMLRVSPEGNFFIDELDADSDKNPLVELTVGWTDCFIAMGPEGAELADISSPPFNPQQEVEIPLDDPSLHPQFQGVYKLIKERI